LYLTPVKLVTLCIKHVYFAIIDEVGKNTENTSVKYMYAQFNFRNICIFKTATVHCVRSSSSVFNVMSSRFMNFC
jgi:hypothetical protein